MWISRRRSILAAPARWREGACFKALLRDAPAARQEVGRKISCRAGAKRSLEARTSGTGPPLHCFSAAMCAQEPCIHCTEQSGDTAAIFRQRQQQHFALKIFAAGIVFAPGAADHRPRIRHTAADELLGIGEEARTTQTGQCRGLAAALQKLHHFLASETEAEIIAVIDEIDGENMRSRLAQLR